MPLNNRQEQNMKNHQEKINSIKSTIFKYIKEKELDL
jgi:hypothetical protein